jgi:hypothetical protein
LSAGGGVEGDVDMKTIIFAIALAVLVLGTSSLAEATIEPNLSIIVATDKLTYELGEYVTIYITGYNVGSETITLGFGTLSQASYLMDDVYDWYAHHYHYGGVSYRVIEPGEDYTWTLVHDSVDIGYYPLTVGTHSVKGEVVDYGYSPLVEFEVIPEPATLLLLTMGAVWIRVSKCKPCHKS